MYLLTIQNLLNFLFSFFIGEFIIYITIAITIIIIKTFVFKIVKFNK